MKYFANIFNTLFLLIITCTSAISQTQHKGPPAPVKVEKVIEIEIQEQVTFIGTVEPEQRSLIATEVSGVVEKMFYKEGDFVKNREVLAILKQDSLQIELKEAKAALKESEFRLEYASKQLVRFKDLYEKAVIPIEEYQEGESECNAWAEKTIQNQSKIERLKYDLNHMQIRAPFNGHIISKHTEIGEWLVTGDSVYEIINLEDIYVLVNAAEQVAVTLKPNDPAEIKFDSFPDLILRGSIQAIIPQASKNARTLPIKVSFQNKDNIIKSGLFARVSFRTGSKAPSKFVSKDAIVEMNNQKFVYIVNNSIAAPIQIETGIAHENLIEIFGPIKVGMDVIIRGNERVMPGQPVQVVK